MLKKKIHKLQGTELQVKVYQVKLLASPYSRTRDTLEVTGLPDDISKDVLELYFENPKSGGCPDAVKNISFPRHGVAQIQFTSDTSKETSVFFIIINARRTCARGITYGSLSVCLLLIYCLLKKFVQQNEHTRRFYADLQRFSTKGFL